MNVQSEVELSITGLSHDGRGIARHENKVVFVQGALPDEVIRAKIVRKTSKFDEAQTMKVITPSAQRRQPDCAHFGICGGCQWQHTSQIQQLQYKQDLLAEQLAQAWIKPLNWLNPLIGPDLAYRQKARLSVKYVEKKNTVLVGFREQKSNKIAIIERCSVLNKQVGENIAALRACIDRLEIKKEIPQIEIAVGESKIALVFRHLMTIPEQDKAILIQFCQDHGYALYLQPHGVESVNCIWPNTEPLELSYLLRDQGLEFHFHPLDFIQVNSYVNQQMVNQALSLIQPTKNDTILDLFCGLGNFSLALAQKSKKVIGVEGTDLMVERARANARKNQLSNVFFHTFDLTHDLSKASFSNQSYSAVVLDPPRCGAQEVVNAIHLFDTNRILYISCNPATFVRDAAILQNQHGYRLEQVGIMDMFTHTAHIETMGLFTI